jgi:hypothetical protein
MRQSGAVRPGKSLGANLPSFNVNGAEYVYGSMGSLTIRHGTCSEHFVFGECSQVVDEHDDEVHIIK